MAQNLVIPNKDNRVTFVFGGVNLTLNTKIEVQFGSESYSTTDAQSIINVDSATELSLDLSGTSEVGRVYATVTYFDSGSVNGSDITSLQLGNSDQIIVAIGSQLIIEDGSIVENANSFNTDDEFLAYANIRGIKVPPTEPERDSLQILAMDYLRGKEYLMKGCRTRDTQTLPFPRIGSCVNDRALLSTEIPYEIKAAQLELALQASKSDLFVNTQVSNIQKGELGSLEATFYDGGSWAEIRTDAADVHLNKLLEHGGSNCIMTRV